MRSTARALAVPLLLYGLSRVVVAAALLVAPVLSPGYDRGSFFSAWDAGHYLRIAEHGYPPLFPEEGGYRAESAFFPLLPWAIRGLSAVTGLSYETAGIVIVNVAAVAAVLLVWQLARESLADEGKAAAAVALVVFWPAAYVFSMVYTDGLLVALAAACLLALSRRRWALAGIAALAAGAARPNGVMLVLPCAWAAIQEFRASRSFRPFVAPVLAPLGVLAYFTFLQIRLGDFFLWFKAEQVGWGAGFSFGRHYLTKVLSLGLAHPTAEIGAFYAGLAGLVGIGLLAWGIAARMPATHLLYSGGVLVFAMGGSPGLSIPRLVLNAFPLFLAPASRLNANWAIGWSAVTAAWLGLMTVVVVTTTVMVP